MSRQIQASVKGNYTSPIFPPFKAHLDEQALWKNNSITSFPCGGLKQPGHRGSLKFHSTWVVMQIILEMAFFCSGQALVVLKAEQIVTHAPCSWVMKINSSHHTAALVLPCGLAIAFHVGAGLDGTCFE